MIIKRMKRTTTNANPPPPNPTAPDILFPPFLKCKSVKRRHILFRFNKSKMLQQ